MEIERAKEIINDALINLIKGNSVNMDGKRLLEAIEVADEFSSPSTIGGDNE